MPPKFDSARAGLLCRRRATRLPNPDLSINVIIALGYAYAGDGPKPSQLIESGLDHDRVTLIGQSWGNDLYVIP
jgi:hypothetical protein